MKKLLTIMAFANLFYLGLGQEMGARVQLGDTSVSVDNTKVKEEEAKVDGSPYLNDKFIVSEVENFEGTLEMRYNAYTDEFEFFKDNQLFNLIKEKYPVVLYGPQKVKWVYTNYNEGGKEVNGFLMTLAEGANYSVYKKESVVFKQAKISKDSYGVNENASYKKLNPKYFVKLNGEIVELPENKKKLAKLFGNNESHILEYFKKTDVDFSKDFQVQSFAKFLANL